MQEASQPDGGLPEGQDQVRLIAADRRVVIVVGSLLHIVADVRVVFEFDLIVLQQLVAFILLCISGDLAHELLPQLHKVNLPILLIPQLL